MKNLSQFAQTLNSVAQELSSSVLLVADEQGRALLYTGIESPKTMDLLAALGAAGLSALQEIILASFHVHKEGEEQSLILEVPEGIIFLVAYQSLIFLAVFRDKSRLGLARLLMRKLARAHNWKEILGNTPQEVENGMDEDDQDLDALFESLWSNQ